MKSIRNSAKAIIIKDKKILLIKGKDDYGYFYILPGGGQESGENLIDTLKRECREELGENAVIEIGDIVLIREYIGKNHEFAEYDSHIHQIEFMFFCSINDDYIPGMGDVPDDMQCGTEWIEIDKLYEIRIYPSVLKKEINRIIRGERAPVYLGDIN